MSIIYNNILDKNKINNYYNDNNIYEAFINSTDYFLAYDDDKLVGALRLLSDKKEWTIIHDLKVSNNDYEISKILINNVINKYGHHIFAYGNKNNLDLYEKLLFKRSKTAFIVDNGINDDYLPKGYKYENELFKFNLSFPVGKKTLLHKDAIINYKKEKDNNFEKINEILSKAFNRNVDLDTTKYTFSNSSKYAFAYDKDKLVGVARAISDGQSSAIILNVAVDPDYQGLHIGLNLINTLKEQLRNQLIFLNTHPGGVGFYNRDGFRRCKYAFAYVENFNTPIEIDKAFNLPIGYRFIDEL
jgi:ribosomal protein S18 acetylase RimI-like enzyme